MITALLILLSQVGLTVKDANNQIQYQPTLNITKNEVATFKSISFTYDLHSDYIANVEKKLTLTVQHGVKVTKMVVDGAFVLQQGGYTPICSEFTEDKLVQKGDTVELSITSAFNAYLYIEKIQLRIPYIKYAENGMIKELGNPGAWQECMEKAKLPPAR